MKKATHLAIVWTISLVATLVSYSALVWPVGHDIDHFFLYKVLRGEPSGKVVVVKIDNESLDRLEKTDLRVLNLTKSVFADLIEKLNAQGAAAIGIDVIFANRSSDETVLAETLAKHPNVVIGAKIGLSESSERVLPLETYSGASWGAVDVVFEKNVVSKIPAYLNTASGAGVETLSVATYRAMVSDVSAAGKFEGSRYVVNPLRSIPVDSDRLALIPFFREPKEYPAYSLADVLEWKVPENAFQGKAVLVGEYGTLIHDAHFAPVGLWITMPGVEFHANMLEGLITGKFLESPSKVETSTLVVLAALVSSAVFLFANPAVSVAYAIGFLTVSLVGAWYALSEFGIVIEYFALALAGVFIAFPSAYAYRYFVVDRNRHYLEKAFSRYVDPEVVEAIAANPEELRLWGEKRHVTVFFSDIAGFTGISESIGTERLFALIGEYLSQMTDILIRNKGTLDKYIGDAVMGIFWAPLTIANSEILACRTALEQQARLRMLRSKWKKEGLPKVEARIGIHSGEAMVGNIGSKSRFNYTAMGDTVNLASRLEGVNKEYGTFVCVSENVVEKAKDEFVFRELDTIRVKGKNEGVRIFELVGFADDPYLDRKKIEAYEKALSTYRREKYLDAKKAFESITDDPPSRAMIERCDELLEGKTRLENGIYSMTTK